MQESPTLLLVCDFVKIFGSRYVYECAYVMSRTFLSPQVVYGKAPVDVFIDFDAGVQHAIFLHTDSAFSTPCPKCKNTSRKATSTKQQNVNYLYHNFATNVYQDLIMMFPCSPLMSYFASQSKRCRLSEIKYFTPANEAPSPNLITHCLLISRTCPIFVFMSSDQEEITGLVSVRQFSPELIMKICRITQQ